MIDELIEPRFEGTDLVIETSGETEVYDSQFLVAALLVYVAKGDGTISDDESQKMLQLIGEHYHLQSAESLELLTRAMTNLAENPDLKSLLQQLSTVLSDEQKEDVAVMLLKVIATDGRADGDEMESMRAAGDIIGIAPDAMHEAFDRYFAETNVIGDEKI